MKEEIKDLLEDFKWYIEQPNNQDINGEYEYPRELLQDEAKLLLDYITNLQEENEKLLKKSYKDDVIITKITEYIKNLKPLNEEETNIKEMLKEAYYDSDIKNTDINFKTICHLEDFEIAIWNIKSILESGDKK